jgi:hypothetical protein
LNSDSISKTADGLGESLAVKKKNISVWMPESGQRVKAEKLKT